MERLRLTFFGILGLSFMVLTGLGAHWLFSQFLQAEFLAELLIRRTLDIILGDILHRFEIVSTTKGHR